MALNSAPGRAGSGAQLSAQAAAARTPPQFADRLEIHQERRYGQRCADDAKPQNAVHEVRIDAQ